MVYIAAVTVLSLLASVVLTLAGWGVPVAVVHLAFAVGIVPLIFGAMIHFVPVLTRSGNPARSISLLPVLAQLAGLLAVAAMQGILPRPLLHGAATLDFVFAVVLAAWMAQRARSALGSPHPGWRWYLAALGCFLMALAAVPVLMAVPDLYGSLRALHLHLNTLGLVGLAALGTLPVLLPTALGKPDPEAGSWLRRRLWPTLAAVLLVALGAAFAWPLSVVGATLLLVIVLGLAGQWWRRFGHACLWNDGAAASLCFAVAGFLVLVAAGVLHGIGLVPARPAIAAWAAGFLMPLVTGALSQLLPVWRWPGPATPARALMRAKLAATGRWRGLLFIGAGILVAAGLPEGGETLAGAGMLLFAVGLVQAVGVPASAR
ncbi:MAG: hypothetical protein ACM31P_15630 [Actinomycetota bacterium]